MSGEECEARGGAWDSEGRACALGGEGKEQLLPWPVTPVPGQVGPDVMDRRIEAIDRQLAEIEAKMAGILETMGTMGYDVAAMKRKRMG